ncbi:MAG: hypothetical protein ABIR04_00895, partial [Cypionkella sp.]
MPPFQKGLADTKCVGGHTDHPLARLTPAHSHTFTHAMLTPAAGAACSTCHMATETVVDAGVPTQCS